MSQQAGDFEQRRQSPTLPFGHRWHLEVSPYTHLLLERRDSRMNAEVEKKLDTGLPKACCSQVEIDFLNLDHEWDVGFVLSIDQAGELLGALGSRTLVSTLTWMVEPEWVTLYDLPATCQFELTFPIRSALALRLRTVLKGLVTPNAERERW